MSLAYRISVSGSESRTIVVEDGVCSGLELLDILPREEMGRMLRAELERRGFKSREDQPGAVVREQDGVEVSVDLEKGNVTIRLGASRDVAVTRERSGQTKDAPGSQEAAKKALRAALQAEIERAIDDEKEGLRAKVTARLEKLLPELRGEIDQAVNRVTGEALKVRASQLGEIEEVVEDEDGSITIRVRT